MSKTALEWFMQLDEPYKSQAIENLNYEERRNWGTSSTLFDFMSDAITGSMSWAGTPQGHEYWNGLYDKYVELDRVAKREMRMKDDEEMRKREEEEQRIKTERRLNNVSMSESMREMLLNISRNSVVATIILEYSDKRLFCDYITMRGAMTSYLPNGREHKITESGRWSREGRQEMKPAKLARRIIPESVGDLQEHHFETYSNLVKAYIGINGDEDGDGRNVSLEVVKGEDIRKYYHEDSYSEHADKGSNLWGSCMRYDNCQDYFDIYVYNDNVSMLIAKYTDGKILGRALLWKCDRDKNAMDTIYAPDSIQPLFISWAVDNDYYYKSSQSCHHSTFDMFRGKRYGDWDAVVSLNKARFEYYPYMDTMMFLSTDCKSVSNQEGGHDKTLRSTDGSYEDANTVWDDDRDEDIHEDDSVYLDYDEGSVSWRGYTHIDNTVMTRFSFRILERHAVDVEGYTYPDGHEDIVYINGACEWFLEENVRECAHNGEMYHIDDMKEVEDDVWVHVDNVEEYLSEQSKIEENV